MPAERPVAPASPVDPDFSAEQMAVIEQAIARVNRKRKILLTGYALALLSMIVGMLGALYVFGSAPPGEFVGWVFFVPVTTVGALLWGFGRWASRV